MNLYFLIYVAGFFYALYCVASYNREVEDDGKSWKKLSWVWALFSWIAVIVYGYSKGWFKVVIDFLTFKPTLKK